MKVSNKYRRALDRYLQWRTGVFLRPAFPYDPNAPSAAEVMLQWETYGKQPVSSCEPDLLADYVQGKRSRDWHITEWKGGCKSGDFVPEEFIGSLGMNEEEFKSVFKMAPRFRLSIQPSEATNIPSW